MISRIKEQIQMHRDKLILIIFLVLLIAIGLILADDYGISWDESVDREYARGILAAYSTSERIDWEQYGVQNNIGPAYLLFWASVSDALGNASNIWDEYIAGHFLNYLAYILGMVFFYGLARQFFKPLTATIITCLFIFQPVLFGHAFINQKDIAFMTMFLGAITSGAIFVKRSRKWDLSKKQAQSSEGLRATIIRDWKISPAYIRTAIFLGIAILFLVCSLVAVSILGSTSKGNIILKYFGFQDNPLESIAHNIRIFLSRGNRPINLDQIGFTYLRPLVFPLIVLVLIILAAGYKLFPNALRALWIDYFRGSYWGNMRIGEWIILLACGAMVGIASSIRVLGPFAGVLVLTLIIWNHGLRLPIQMGLLIIVSQVISYATWPFLWDNPITHYIEVIRIAARHPWRGFILFEGIVHSAEAIPWYFVPKMLILQLSEPLLVIILLGMVSMLRSKNFPKTQKALGLVLLLWFVIPISIPVFGNAIVYDNFRQFLFALPPLLILAGFGLESIFRRVNLLRWKFVIGLIALLPGVYSIINLHPYQYMYYNELAGGTRGAFRNYELDYWCTSYRDIFHYANEVLPDGVSVAVWGPILTAEAYAREDLILEKIGEDPGPEELIGKYLILCTRHNTDLRLGAGRELLFEASKEDIPLAKLYDLATE